MKRDFVLSIIIVPNIEPTIASGKEENATSCWREATIGEINIMIFGSYNRNFQVFDPQLASPVTD